MGPYWVVVVGSHRRGRNTDTVADAYVSALESCGRSVRKLMLAEVRLNPCSGCEYCLNSEGCHHGDKLDGWVQSLREAEGILLASPSYFYNVTGPMKVFIDRTFSLYRKTSKGLKSVLEPRCLKGIVVGTCAGDSPDSMGATIAAMSSALEDHGVHVLLKDEWLGTKAIPAANRAERLESIRAAVRNLLEPAN